MAKKQYGLIADKYFGKKMLAPMYFIGDEDRIIDLRKKGYTDIRRQRKK